MIEAAEKTDTKMLAYERGNINGTIYSMDEIQAMATLCQALVDHVKKGQSFSVMLKNMAKVPCPSMASTS